MSAQLAILLVHICCFTVSLFTVFTARALVYFPWFADHRDYSLSALAPLSVSVVQADKTARSSALQFYGTILFCILFFGGFFVKSYLEDAIFQRDTRRLLAYYKRSVPGSMHDGDEHSARYLVYKYRNKKAKLWARLEKKYGYPMPEDWDAFVKEVEEEPKAAKAGTAKKVEEDVSDLDKEEKEQSEQGETKEDEF